MSENFTFDIREIKAAKEIISYNNVGFIVLFMSLPGQKKKLLMQSFGGEKVSEKKIDQLMSYK